MTYELYGNPVSLKKIRDDFESFLQLLKSRGIDEVAVYFGWAWQLEIEDEDWEKPEDSPAGVREQVKRAERVTDGFIGGDELFITVREFSYQRQYCHSADVRITSEYPNQHTEEQKLAWIADGWEVHESIDGEWREVEG